MGRNRYPLERYRTASSVALFLLFSVFVLLLLVSVSVPLLKPVYILALRTTTQTQGNAESTELRFGVWGMCTASATGNQPGTLAACVGPRLGYDATSSITTLLGLTADTSVIVSKTLLTLLILHLVAAGLALLSLLFTLFLGSICASVIALLLSVLGALASTIVFAVDLSMVILARQEIAQANLQLEALYGNAIWLVLAATCTTWVACLVLFSRVCHCCGVSKHSNHAYYDGF